MKVPSTKNMTAGEAAIALLIALVLLFGLAHVGIWAINALFGAGLTHSFGTALTMMVAIAVFRG